MIRVSVVVPAFNAALYLPRCLDSLLAQTCRSFEVLVVNDGSTDETPAIAEEYAAQDSRIHVIHQDNGGLSNARNAGLAAASGIYVIFLDSDDWVEPTMIDSMASCIQAKDAEVAIAGAVVDFHDEKDNLYKSDPRTLPAYDIVMGQPIPSSLIDDNFMNLFGYAWNKIYHREWLIGLNEWFEDDLILIEDVDFNSRVLSEASHITINPNYFVHYVQRPRASLGAIRNSDYLALRSRAIDCGDAFLRSFGLDESTREDRRLRANAIALWSGLNAAAVGSSRRDSIKKLVKFPGAESLSRSIILPKHGGWRGFWASFTIRRGWYGVALIPVVVAEKYRIWRHFVRHLVARLPSRGDIQNVRFLFVDRGSGND